MRKDTEVRMLVAVLVATALLLPGAAGPATGRPSQEPAGGQGALPEAPDPSTPVPASSRPWLVALHERGEPYSPDLLRCSPAWGPTSRSACSCSSATGPTARTSRCSTGSASGSS